MSEISTTTVKLGYVLKNRGEYISEPETRYYKDNVVQYNGASFIADPVGYDRVTNPLAYVTVAPYDVDPDHLNDGWKVFASDAAYVNSFMFFTENPEWAYVVCDSEDKILFGVKQDGEFYFSAGCPPQVKSYIEEKISALSLDEYESIVAFLDGLIGSDTTLKMMLDSLEENKVDKEEGKSLIDSEHADAASHIENPEYLQVTTDSEDKVLEGIKSDGTKVIGGDLQVNGNIINEGIQGQIDAAIEEMQEEVNEMLEESSEKLSYFESAENPEWLSVTTDSEGKILEGITTEGNKKVMVETEIEGDVNFKGNVFFEKSLPDTKYRAFTNSGIINSSTGVLTLPQVHISKNYMFSAHYTGETNHIILGIGYISDSQTHRQTNSKWFDIASEQVTLYTADTSGQGSTVMAQETNPITFNELSVFFDVDNEQRWKFKMVNEIGLDFSMEGTGFDSEGIPFIQNLSNTDIDVEIKFTPKDLLCKTWLFGDSYCATYMNTKWPYYLVNWGYTSYLSNALSGLSPSMALEDLENLLSLGYKPSYVLWCLGMNGPADPEVGVINPAQKVVIDSVLNICLENNIIPIFATIPTVPSRQKTGLTNYIKSLGVRYVDYAEAVGSDSSGNWNNRLLSYDEVHPSQYGALVLAHRCLADFSEITILS